MRKLFIILIFIGSLCLNAAMFISETIYSIASSVFTELTGMPTAASKIHPKNTKINFKGKKVTVAQAVGSTTNGVKRRAAKTAVRSVSAMAFEAAPLIGTAAIIGITALELRDLCETAKDMDALNRALNPDEATDVDRTAVCSIAVPTREELQYKVSDRSEEISNEFKTFFLELKEE